MDKREKMQQFQLYIDSMNMIITIKKKKKKKKVGEEMLVLYLKIHIASA